MQYLPLHSFEPQMASSGFGYGFFFYFYGFGQPVVME